MLNLDTHILLHAVAGKLTGREDRLLRIDRWSISAIVLWEIAKLAQLGRIEVDLQHPEVVRVLSGLYIWPISVKVAQVSAQLDVRVDPADELIAATSIVHGLPLVTRDRQIRASSLVPLA
jgi:PIN domain nuclease of toxin-antitoxin system